MHDEQLRILDHPLADDALRLMRDETTGPAAFRGALERMTTLLCVAALEDAPRQAMLVRTPLEETAAATLGGRVLIAPVLRAGLGMVDPMLRLVPDAVVGCLGFYRNEQSLQPVAYYEKLPEAGEDYTTLVVDPMLATGGTSVAALDLLKERGFPSPKLLCVIAAPEGVMAVRSVHPDVAIVAGALDRELNERGYILPGLGDAGDRQLGTL
ncbi:Uracil phosphoribosyltransferase [Mucisphaera calidilacus]|uniref:Uracil phosphoribosyltransferase n=2 Tax=Mucisphaera calidilacus TaxID=2527982 RepID=A0A518BZ84_9BACT|nr:Uracil phosphoribosyltransferase [Mucisphaera calidilacus]